MNEILDDFNEQKKNRIATKIATIFSIVSLIAILYFFLLMPTRIRASEIAAPPFWIILLVNCTLLIGGVASIVSIFRKEEKGFINYIAILINLVLLISLIVLILSPNIPWQKLI